MKFRHAAVLAFAAVALGACKKKQPPTVTPAPAATDDDAARRAREQARADSIAAAERTIRERSDRARTASLARVREVLSDIVYFEYDSEQLNAEAQDKLRTKAAIMRVNPTLQIRIEGHADQRGSTEYNLALAQRRAESVRDFLAGYGITADRVTTLSYGEERPAVEGEGEDAWVRNRRAEFSITGGDITTAPPEVQ